MAKSTSSPQIWHKIINKFNTTRLKYVLVGGAALVIHGFPRSTLDMDIYVPAKEGALNKLCTITKSLGLESKQKAILNIAHSPELFANQWLCFSYKGQDVLDVFLAREDEFAKLYKKSQKKQDKTLTIRVARLSDIKAIKKASGRPVDIADIKLIEEAKRRL